MQIIFMRGLGLIITYASLMFLTNYFSEDLVGKYNFANNILLVVGTICLLGSNQAIFQFSGQYYDESNPSSLKKLYIKFIFISSVVFIVLVVFVAVIPKTLFSSFFEEDEAYRIIFKVVLFSFFYFLSSLNFEALRVINKTKTSEFFRSIFRSLLFVLILYVIYKLNEKTYVVEALLASFLITAVLSSVAVWIKIGKRSKKKDQSSDLRVKQILKVSLPITAGALFIYMMQTIDSFFIVKYETFGELAYYSIAVKLTTVLAIILTSINTIIAVDISKHYFSRNHFELKKVIFRASKLNFLLTVPFLILLLLFSKSILSLFGQNYSVAHTPLLILSAGQLVSTFLGSVGLYLNMTNKQNIFLILLFIALVINLFLNKALIPIYGINGAAIANSASLIFWNVSGAIFIYKKDRVITFFRMNDK